MYLFIFRKIKIKTQRSTQTFYDMVNNLAVNGKYLAHFILQINN
jgi:hypothetical protein